MVSRIFGETCILDIFDLIRVNALHTTKDLLSARYVFVLLRFLFFHLHGLKGYKVVIKEFKNMVKVSIIESFCLALGHQITAT